MLKKIVKGILRYDQRIYNKYVKQELLSEQEKNEQRNYVFQQMPLISIIIVAANVHGHYSDNIIQSIIHQTYKNWELIVVNDGKCKLITIAEKDSRIKFLNISGNVSIGACINRAVKLCRGKYILFQSRYDMLLEQTLFECIKCINSCPSGELFYMDEDKISLCGRKYHAPHFKSDYNMDLLYSNNYIGTTFLVSRCLVKKVGNRREEYGEAQEYDFLLRCTETTDQIIHIPKILYHHRETLKDIFFPTKKAKEKNREEIRALQKHFNRNGIPAEAKLTTYKGVHRVQYELVKQPMVTIIIPNKDHIKDLDCCLKAIEKKAGYKNYEIIIIENNSEREETFIFYNDILQKYKNIRVVFWKGRFNYAAINNWGVQFASGELLLFLNNDVEWISNDFLKEMVTISLRKEVGIVGSLLYFPDESVQHAGVIMGYSGIAGHAFIGTPRGVKGYHSRIVCIQQYSAVTAACMMIKKEIFLEVDGFDEQFVVAFNDIDLCLRVLRRGKLIVYDPYAQAYHYESKTRGSDNKPENIERFEREKELLRERWGWYIDKGDPYYNKNLSLDRPDFMVKDKNN